MSISAFFHDRLIAYICLLSLIMGAGGAFFTIKYAHLLGMMDRPGARSSHTVPTPKGGGTGVLAAFIFSCTCLHMNFILWIPAVLVSLMSYAGDRTHISPLLRLCVQLAAALLVVFSMSEQLARITTLTIDHSTLQMFLHSCCIMAAAVYIAGTANFYNFMDGINGMAAITGTTGFGMMAMYGMAAGYDPALITLNLSIACACLGFMPFNVPLARVFMGDVGSILLGFIFGTMTLLMATNPVEYAVLCSFIFPVYADELVTMAERIRDGDRLASPHRRHLYQVMANEAGIAHWKVSLGYGVIQLLAGAGTWGVYSLNPAYVPCLLLFYAAAFLLINSRFKARYT